MPQISKNFELKVSPEQFLAACSPDEIQELEILLQSGQYQVKMLKGKSSEVIKWMQLYTEHSFTIEELDSCSLRIDAEPDMPRQEKLDRLIAISHVLTTFSEEKAVESARNVLELAKKYRS